VNAIAIRRWRPEDTEELATLFKRTVREIASRDYSADQIAAWAMGPDDFAERMAARVTFVAVEGTRLVGFIQYEPPDHIDMTYVHAERQNMGVATALLKALEDEARSRNVPTLRVEASITARPFFEKRGYAVIAQQIVHARGAAFVNYRMGKTLAESA